MAPPASSKSHADGTQRVTALRNSPQSRKQKKKYDRRREGGLTASHRCIGKLEHGLIDYLIREGTDERRADKPLVSPPSPKHLRYTVLLTQERLLVHLIEKTPLAGPRAECLEVLETLFLWPDVAHLNHDQRILIRRSGCEKHIGIKLPRCTLDAITEVAQKRRCSRAMEAACHGVSRQGSPEIMVGAKLRKTHYIRLPAKTTGTGYARAL